MKVAFWFCLLVVSSLAFCQALEEEEEDPSRPSAEGVVDVDTSANDPLFRRKLRHNRSRNHLLVNKNVRKSLSSDAEVSSEIDELQNKKHRQRNRRIRRKKLKNSKENNSFNRHRRKSFQHSEALTAPRFLGNTDKYFDKPSPDQKRPNIVLIMTDDQDVELGSLQFMPKLNRYLLQEGMSFNYGYVSTPMCCPSRSSMLTGLYVHNHNVLTNNDNCSSPMWIEKHEPRTFAKYLNQAGYKTGYFGKYLNKYNGNRIPEGWDEWMGLIRNSRFYNYTLNINGNKVKHGFNYAKDYFPDLITNDSLAFFRQAKHRDPAQPILMVMSYPGPHGPEDSAPQYADLFFNVTTHHTPAYDYAPNPDKQWVLQVTDRMEPIQKKFTDFLMTKRLQTLQSIDDAVERLYHELDALGELENTFIFYTSDHGYHLGQFGLVKGKSFPFELDTKVPFIVRGPGIERGSSRSEPVVNIDLAPTFIDLAGVSPLPAHMDGRSIVPLFTQTSKNSDEPVEPWRHAFLIERGKMTATRYQKIQRIDEITGLGNSSFPPLPNASFLFPDDDDEETGDDEGLEDDDDKMEESAVDVSVDIDKTFTSMPLLNMDQLTKQERLAVECQKPRLQAPCQLYQRHKCIRKKNGLWRIKRCHPKTGFNQRFSFYDESSDEQSLTTNCVCDQDKEKYLQKQFIRKHLPSSTNLRHQPRHKFIKDIMQEDNVHHRRRRSSNSDSDSETGSSSADIETVLTEMADQDIVGVDIIMDDIADEIKTLQDQIVDTTTTPSPTFNQTMILEESSMDTTTQSIDLPCQLSASREVNCRDQIYENQEAWKSSRAYINDQIRRLRAQLSELKEIRKHLKQKRPLQSEEDSEIEDSPRFKQQKRCHCKRQSQSDHKTSVQIRRLRRREKIKMARMQRQLRRKEQRRKKMKKMKNKRKKESCNIHTEKLNCFTHNNDHWKTEPLWTHGSFCACTNSNTNTYSCVRNINATHNYLYCEFVSGIITYYDLKIDPHQLRNIYQTLSHNELNYMHKQLLHLKKYKGQNDLDPKAQRTMAEYGNPAQPSRKISPDLTADASVAMAVVAASTSESWMRQQKFIKKYGQYLPPPNAYHQVWE